MIEQLYNYIKNPNNGLDNYHLALEYDLQNQTSAAISFYLKAAELTSDDTLAYECFIKMADCFDRQKNRNQTVKGLLQQAISLLPTRPEAYFLLSRYHETYKEYSECYTLTCIALTICDFNLPPLKSAVSYPGKYGIIFEKAVSSWWWGRNMEARRLFQTLVNVHWNEMDQTHRNSVEDNITRLGSGPESQAFTMYDKSQYSNLKFKFNLSDTISNNYSQVYQDLFILSMLNGKQNGKFLEIGGARPYHGNNTALLEEQFGWKGVSIEFNQDFANEYAAARKNTVMLCEDALKINYEELLKKHFEGTNIDYLQLDIEPARHTFEALLNIPFNKYKFAVITYEHDYYVDVTKSYREKSRNYLKNLGYELIVNDISPDGISNFEDWWVHPDLIDPEIMKKMRSVTEYITSAKSYMLNSDNNSTKIKIEQGKLTIAQPIPTVATETTKLTISQSTPAQINSNYRNGIWVVDNFYSNPDTIREFALTQEYHQGGLGRGYIGRRTFQQFLFPGLKEEFEKIMGKKITKWEEHGMNGRFQYSMEGEPLVYHCDSQQWGAMIYLTPDAPLETGTGSFALKGTKVFHNSQEGIMAAFRGDGAQNLDKTLFEPVDSIGNVYNRLVIFNAGYLHAALGYFGYKPENARLWQMFFFD